LFDKSSLKHYFDLQPVCVLKKLQLIFFPFLPDREPAKPARDSFDFADPTQPTEPTGNPENDGQIRDKYKPDLYIPAMAFMTYILLTCLYMGTKNLFTPASITRAAGYCSMLTTLEALVIKFTIYITNSGNPAFLDTVSLASYKYFGLCFIVITNLVGEDYTTTSWGVRIYYALTSAVLVFKMVQKLGESQRKPDDSPRKFYDETKTTAQLKFIAMIIAGSQLALSWILVKLSVF